MLASRLDTGFHQQTPVADDVRILRHKRPLLRLGVRPEPQGANEGARHAPPCDQACHQSRFRLSTRKVTGPSLTRLTAMVA